MRLRLALPFVLTLFAASGAAQDLRQASRRIDQLLEKGLRDAGLRPEAEVDDSTRVRRTFLVVAGRVPTLEELDRWTGAGPGKSHDALVDELLASPGRVSHAFNEWADVLRIQSRFGRRISGEPYMHFLKEALAQNRPYDAWVRELLTAEGAAHERGNGATGFWLRDFEMPLDAMSNTMRVFLGTRMECAQCHDHPFEDWTQRQFYELAAFNGGMRYSSMDLRNLQRSFDGARAKVVRDFAQENGANGRTVVRRLVQNQGVGLAGDGNGTIRLPKDYAYDDARPNSMVRAHVPFGPDVSLPEPPPAVSGPAARVRARRGQSVEPPPLGSREAFAAWLTSPDNPRFTTVIVNRVFKSTFGRALIEPVDDLGDDTAAVYPDLQEYLEDLMRDLSYDLVAFQRVLLNTRLFRRGAAVFDESGEEPFRFPGPALRRMSAEQVWDSLLALALGDPDRTLKVPGASASSIYAEHARVAALDAAGLEKLLDEEMLRYTDRPAYIRVVAARRAAARAQATSADSNAATDFRAKIQELTVALRKARRERDQDEAARIVRAIADARRDAAAQTLARNPQFARASELSQPAPPGHFVREWGQSDREQIASSSLDANVPQALQLINGVVDARLLADGSALDRALDSCVDSPARVTTAFRAVLGRDPSSSELRSWVRLLQDEGGSGVADLVWTLVNSHEFRFVQ